jgi:phosphomannomutase
MAIFARMTVIKFGTDGWRAIIGREYTTANVARVATATALWIKSNQLPLKAVIGHDCRFGGELFAQTATKVLAQQGIKVYLAKGVVTTPMLSLATQRLDAGIGVVITASHNPPAYNGYKLKSPYGGPTSPSDIAAVEALIPAEAHEPDVDVQHLLAQGLVEYVDLETMYAELVESYFDMEAIRNSGLVVAYDAMYGAGLYIVPHLLPDAVLLHCDENPSFKGTPPEPLHKNLLEFSELIKKATDIDFGFAHDGDADRIGVYDSRGNFVDSHHVILLLIHYLVKYKGMKGKVVVAFSVTDKVKKLCEVYGLEYQVTKIGFKYICEIMVNDDVLVGGEESGGIAVKGHIPERDGVWNALLLMEFMAKTGKSLRALIQEVYDIVGPFAYDRYDLHITEEQKMKVLQHCRDGAYSSFGSYKIIRTEDTDGYKYFLDEESWVMVRASGTEPVLRVYCESRDKETVIRMLDAAKATLLS